MNKDQSTPYNLIWNKRKVELSHALFYLLSMAQKIQAMSGPILKQFKNQIHKFTYVQKSIPE